MKYLFFIVSLSFLIACHEDVCTPPPNYFLIDLQDSTGNHLIGTIYQQDPFFLFANLDSFALEAYSDAIQISLDDIQSQKAYYLKLSETDFDTLWISFLRKDGTCGHYFDVDSFRYNQMAIPRPWDDRHIIIK